MTPWKARGRPSKDSFCLNGLGALKYPYGEPIPRIYLGAVESIPQPRGAAFQAADTLSSGSSRPEGRPRPKTDRAKMATTADVSFTVDSGNPEFVVPYQLIVRPRVEHRPSRATVGDLAQLFDPLRVRVLCIERQGILQSSIYSGIPYIAGGKPFCPPAAQVRHGKPSKWELTARDGGHSLILPRGERSEYPGEGEIGS